MKTKVIFLIVFLSAIFLRFYKLGEAPKGFYLDEAAIGYNAYSILKTGKDEFGYPLPWIFRSFVDFKAPVYSYILIPLLYFWDLTVFATRFPSAFLGVMTIPLAYLLIIEVAPKEISKKIALATVLVLSISPWHIIFSRTTYETNIALFFLTAAILLFYKSIKKPWFLLLSGTLFAAAFLSYHAERLIAPLVVLYLVLRHIKVISKNIFRFVLPAMMTILVGLALVWPTVKLMNTPGFLSRATTLNIFSYARQMPPWYVEKNDGKLPSLTNNPKFFTLKEWASLYGSYFSPRYLFSLGDSGPRSSYPDLSTFYVWQFPFYLIGLYFLLRSKRYGELKPMTIMLLLVTPIAASMTRDPYSTIRSLAMVVPLCVVVGIGIVESLDFANKKGLQGKFVVGIVMLSVFSMVKLYNSVFVLNEYFRASYWEYGLKETADEIRKLDQRLPIVFDNSRAEPYIQMLFFLKFDPEKYQNDNFEVSKENYYIDMNRNINKKIGNVEMRRFVWGDDTDKKEQYLITDALALSDDQIRDHKMIKVKDILYPNGSVAYKIVKTRIH